MNLRAAFEVAGTYTMIKQEGEYVDQEAQLLKRIYLDALEYLVTPHQDLDQFLTHIEEARSEETNGTADYGGVEVFEGDSSIG